MTRNEQIIVLRKTTNLSMSQIGLKLGLSKNVVHGVLNRAGPDVCPRDGEPRTLYQRCDALHARMDAILAETKDIPRVPVGKNQLPVPTWGFPRTLARGMLADD